MGAARLLLVALGVGCLRGAQSFLAPTRRLQTRPLAGLRRATEETQEEVENIYYEEVKLYADATACAMEVVLDITKQEQLDFILKHAAGADPIGGESKPHSLLIIMVHATWCRKCKYMISKFLAQAKAHPEVLCLKLNFAKEPDIGKSLGVRGVPLFILFKNGKRLDHFYCEDEDDLNQHIDDNL